MMLAEPVFNPRQTRERAVELMFETFRPPALFLAKNAVLSSFAVGRQTSLVVDLGHEGSASRQTPDFHRSHADCGAAETSILPVHLECEARRFLI